MKPTQFPLNEKIDFEKRLRVKFGIDPTSDKLHLGHLVPLLIVKSFLKQGHHVDIVLGTFTAQLGDPSGKDAMRPILDMDTTMKNAESIVIQLNRILDDRFLNISCNHVWFKVMNSIEMINIISKFTTTQLLSRDSFQKRISANNPIGMHELVVPILQGYDSVHLKTDIEIGGTDQLFNFGITRDMQRIHGQTPEVCFLAPIINGTDGRKMSKSFGNCIFINDTPDDVFGKTMSISDELMKEWWPIFSDSEFPTPEEGIDFPGDFHPMKLKKDLAWLITKLIWNHDLARDAFEKFESRIQNKELPTEMKEVKSGELLIDIIKEARNCSSSEAKRLLLAKAISINGVCVGETFGNFKISELGAIIKIGKRNFIKIV